MQDYEPSLASFAVTVLILPDSSLMCVASVLEPLRAANRVSGKQLYDWKLTTLDGFPVQTTAGSQFMADEPFSDRLKGDLLVVVGGFNQQRHVSSTDLGMVRKAASGFETLAGIEAGSWVLARAGLLNGFSATTHWEDFEAFEAAFPDVYVRLDRFVVDANRMTCGGASPAFDMFIDLIRKRNGPSIAMEVASVFIYDEAKSQFEAQPLVSLGQLARKEVRLELAVRMMEKQIEQPLPVAAIARRVGVSSNTLEAIFKRHTGMTPGRFYLNLRLKSANRMVLNSDLSLREIAVRSGFNSLSAFSRAYANGFGEPARLVRAAKGKDA